MLSSQGSTGHGFSSKLTHVVIGRIWILMGCWTKGLDSSLAVAQRPASVPCSMAHPIGQLTTWQPDLSEWRLRDKEGDRVTVTIFYSLLMKMISHHSCCVLFIRSQSLGPAHAPGEEEQRGHLTGPPSTTCLKYFIVSLKKKKIHIYR